MTTLAEINKDIERITQQAKEYLEKFNNATSKNQDRNTLKIIEREKEYLNKVQQFNGGMFLINLNKLMKNNIDANIEQFIKSMQKNDDTNVLKVQSEISLRMLINLLRKFEAEINISVQELNKNMTFMEKPKDQGKETHNAISDKKNNLLRIINNTQLIDKPENTKNSDLNIAYEKMQSALKGVQNVASKFDSIEKSIGIDSSYSTLKEGYKQYVEYKLIYKNLKTLQELAENELKWKIQILPQTLEILKNLINSFPKEDQERLLLDEQKIISNLDNKKYDLDKANDIIKNFDEINQLMVKIEEKYQQEISRANELIQIQKKSINQKLEQMNNFLKHLPEEDQKRFNTEYEILANETNILLDTMPKTGDLKSFQEKNNKFKSLIVSINKKSNEIEKQVVEILEQKLFTEIQRLRKVITETEVYKDVLSKIENIQEPIDKKELHFNNKVAQILKNKLDALKEIELEYTTVKTSVDLFVTRINEGNMECFQECLQSIIDKQDWENITNVLNKVNQKIGNAGVAAMLNTIDLNAIPSDAVKRIKSFINAHKFNEIADAKSIREKITCYELLKDHSQYLAEIKNDDFRQALLFLDNKKISTAEAVKLISSSEKRKLILEIKKHFADTITNEQITHILASDLKSTAAEALIGIIKNVGSKENREELFTCLINELATREDSFAQAIVNIQTNEHLFTPFFLLCLINKEVNNENSTFFVNKLSSKDESKLYENILTTYYKDHKDNRKDQLTDEKFELLKTKAYSETTHPFFSKITTHKVDITILTKLFNMVDDLFDPLIKNATNVDTELKENLKKTKMEIFDAFSENNYLQDGFKKATEIISINFKDNRNILQVLRDGFAAIIEKIQNLFSKEKEEPENNNFQNLNVYQQKKHLFTLFKTQIEDRLDDKNKDKDYEEIPQNK